MDEQTFGTAFNTGIILESPEIVTETRPSVFKQNVDNGNKPVLMKTTISTHPWNPQVFRNTAVLSRKVLLEVSELPPN